MKTTQRRPAKGQNGMVVSRDWAGVPTATRREMWNNCPPRRNHSAEALIPGSWHQRLNFHSPK